MKKVRCTNNSGVEGSLVKGQVYQVQSEAISVRGAFYYLEEFPDHTFWASRFEDVVEETITLPALAVVPQETSFSLEPTFDFAKYNGLKKE